jgi:hypothetical protein
MGFVAAATFLNKRPFPPGKDYLVNVVRTYPQALEISWLDPRAATGPRKTGERWDVSLMKRQLAWCHAQQCDVVVAGLHWGHEWEFYPRQRQIEIAHELAEAGADLIVGHHPHVIQPMEWYRTQRDSDRVVPIFYSLGNLVPIVTAPFSALSIVAQLTFTTGEAGGTTKTLVAGVRLVPVIQQQQTENGIVRARLEPLQRLWQNREGEADRARIEEAASYADVALGPGWRQKNLRAPCV